MCCLSFERLDLCWVDYYRFVQWIRFADYLRHRWMRPTVRLAWNWLNLLHGAVEVAAAMANCFDSIVNFVAILNDLLSVFHEPKRAFIAFPLNSIAQTHLDLVSFAVWTERVFDCLWNRIGQYNNMDLFSIEVTKHPKWPSNFTQKSQLKDPSVARSSSLILTLCNSNQPNFNEKLTVD